MSEFDGGVDGRNRGERGERARGEERGKNGGEATRGSARRRGLIPSQPPRRGGDRRRRDDGRSTAVATRRGEGRGAGEVGWAAAAQAPGKWPLAPFLFFLFHFFYLALFCKSLGYLVSFEKYVRGSKKYRAFFSVTENWLGKIRISF